MSYTRGEARTNPSDFTNSIRKELEDRFSIIVEEGEQEEHKLDLLFKKILFQEYSLCDEVYPTFNQALFENFLENGCQLTNKNIPIDHKVKQETQTSNFGDMYELANIY